MSLSLKTTKQMHNGVEIPVLGLGVYQSPAGETTKQAVSYAIEAGYRHFDTAKIYGNEQSVGEAIKASGLPRSEVFVTTKLWNGDHGYDKTIKALHRSLERLGLDYVDLYLIHWPVENLRLESWRAMQTLLEEGKCRAIGVSNYMVHHLEELLADDRAVPAVNQIELSPYNYRQRLPVVELCEKNRIALEAYSPLTKGRKLKEARLQEMAERYHKTPAQALIRWGLQHDFVVLPKSVHRERIQENADVFDFEISADDMQTLDSWNEDLATGWDPTDAA